MTSGTPSDDPILARLVSVERIGRIAVVTVDNPPVNAIGHAVRSALFEAFGELAEDASVGGIVIGCAGRTFFAGADASEFGKPPLSPTLRDVIAQVDDLRVPTIAAMHGTVLGGGLELALACRYRIAAKGTKLGLPEVKLGLIPGAGGTVRLTHLLGPIPALKMIVTGEPIDASVALERGLIDAIADREIDAAAIAHLEVVIARGETRGPIGSANRGIAVGTRAEIDAAAKDLLAKAGQLEAPGAAVSSIINVLSMSFAEALVEERRLFVSLLEGSQSKALRHAFFAERAAGRLDIPTPAPPVLENVGVVGSGTMGGGIAMAFANAGVRVTVVDVSDDALSRGRSVVEKNYAASEKRGSLSAADVRERVQRISWSTNYDALANSSLVIEAAFEDLGVKRDVIRRLDASCAASTVFATNTSYLDVDDIASESVAPQRVLGMHFFSPANVMKLVEIARGRHTTDAVLGVAHAAAKRIGKFPVFVGLCRGFVGNRMLAARNGDTIDLLLEGASPSAVDAVFVKFGWPMGPFQAQDLAGLDISWRNRRSLGTILPIADDLVERGRLGQKTGGGFYRYEEGSRVPLEDQTVLDLIEQKARELGKTRRQITEREILERTHYALVNEGGRILDEGIARAAADVDVVWLHGFGFPRWRGGPMFWASETGVSHVVERLDYWHAVTGKAVFQTSGYLRNLVDAGGKMDAK